MRRLGPNPLRPRVSPTEVWGFRGTASERCFLPAQNAKQAKSRHASDGFHP